jgi:uncharacterized membrane protein
MMTVKLLTYSKGKMMKDLISKYAIVTIFAVLFTVAIVIAFSAAFDQAGRDAKVIEKFSAACTQVGGIAAYDRQKMVCLK